MFDQVGFEATTIDDIADAAAIGRRTFFSYFASKNDLPWAGFDVTLAQLRQSLATVSTDWPVMDGIKKAIIEYHMITPAEQEMHRRRVHLISKVPALQAHSTLRYAEWREIVAEFAARKVGEPVDSLIPRTIAHASLAVILAAYEQWMQTIDSDLVSLLETGMDGLAEVFAQKLESKFEGSPIPTKKRVSRSARG
ncbi:regulatory protein TetR [Novosphingobium pentaromativorans US6-1]|uniref:Regulatory protein TetR n=1 Tax=Novosphingobium pentaromativorans US6-1 TaxID=1088721 RepID=G6EH30_9SPHN|nr:regulatory protein TetR [Novosphingobium pentaromativorans US6-1]